MTQREETAMKIRNKKKEAFIDLKLLFFNIATQKKKKKFITV